MLVELTVDYVRQRQAFGKTLWDQQVVRNKLSWIASKAAAARALTYQCAQMIAEGKDTVREVSMLKAFAAETLQEVVHTCLQLHGGTGFIIGTPIERMARDSRILTIGGGATEVTLEEVAKRMSARHAKRCTWNTRLTAMTSTAITRPPWRARASRPNSARSEHARTAFPSHRH